MQEHKININSDLIGISSSVLCIIHCLALPVLFVTGGFAGVDAHAAEGFHWMDMAFAGIALLAAFFTGRHTHRKYIRKLLTAGWLMFMAGVLLKGDGILHYLMHAGSLVLIATHVHNLIICRKKCSHDH